MLDSRVCTGLGGESLSSSKTVAIVGSSELAVNVSVSSRLTGGVAVTGGQIGVGVQCTLAGVTPVAVSCLASIELLGQVLVG